MFNRHSSNDKKIITKSLCIIAFAVPFICPSGETKASEIISGENKLFVGNSKITIEKIIFVSTEIENSNLFVKKTENIIEKVQIKKLKNS